MWVPSAEPRFASLGRSAVCTLVHSADHEILIVEDPIRDSAGSKIAGRLTWLVRLPADASMDQEIEFNPATGGAWLIEDLSSQQSHATPASGSILIHSRDADTVSASINLRARGPRAAAGSSMASTTELDRRFDFVRAERPALGFREMPTRSGTTP